MDATAQSKVVPQADPTDAAAQTDAAPPAENEAPLSIRQRAKPAREGRDIHLSDTAAAKIKDLLAKDNYPDTMYLYVGVKGGGCSGLQYTLDLRDEVHAPAADTDEVFQSHGINIVSDLKSYVVGNLSGTLIDYRESVMGAGFTFNNPNAKHTCGCGSSYSA